MNCIEQLSTLHLHRLESLCHQFIEFFGAAKKIGADPLVRPDHFYLFTDHCF